MSSCTRMAVGLTLVVAMGAACVQGQETRQAFGIVLGRTIPTGAFHAAASGEGFNGGWTAGGRLTLERRNSRLGLRIDASYAEHDANDQLKADLTTALGQASDESMTLLGVDASLVYPLLPTSRVAPSLFGGVGLWFVSIGVTSGSATNHTSAFKPAWQLGGEVRYGSVFLEARYVAVAAMGGLPRVTCFPIALGLRFGRGSSS